MRWIWIDRFTHFQEGVSATAVKLLSHAEDYFADHFPGYPVMPACLMIEGMAQTGGILVGSVNQFTKNVVLGKVVKAVFYYDVFPGDSLSYTATIVDVRDGGGTITGKIMRGEDLIADVDLFFAHVAPELTKEFLGDGNFVFTGQLQKMLGLAKSASQNADK
ncbi:MAG: 3-hydroxyacyl-ACP dehydratase FabZ family protein [Zavarzinella sp.]